MNFNIKKWTQLNGFYNENNTLEAIQPYAYDDVFVKFFRDEIKYIPETVLTRLSESDLFKHLSHVNQDYLFAFYVSETECKEFFSHNLEATPHAAPYTEFPHFDAMMEDLFMNLPYKHYKELKKNYYTLIQSGTVNINEYYGNSSTYTVQAIKIADLIELINMTNMKTGE